MSPKANGGMIFSRWDFSDIMGSNSAKPGGSMSQL